MSIARKNKYIFTNTIDVLLVYQYRTLGGCRRRWKTHMHSFVHIVMICEKGFNADHPEPSSIRADRPSSGPTTHHDAKLVYKGYAVLLLIRLYANVVVLWTTSCSASLRRRTNNRAALVGAGRTVVMKVCPLTAGLVITMCSVGKARVARNAPSTFHFCSKTVAAVLIRCRGHRQFARTYRSHRAWLSSHTLKWYTMGVPDQSIRLRPAVEPRSESTHLPPSTTWTDVADC